MRTTRERTRERWPPWPISDDEEALLNSQHHAAHSSLVAGVVARVGTLTLPDTTVLFGSMITAAATKATPAGASTAATGLAGTAAAGDAAALDALLQSRGAAEICTTCG